MTRQRVKNNNGCRQHGNQDVLDNSGVFCEMVGLERACGLRTCREQIEVHILFPPGQRSSAHAQAQVSNADFMEWRQMDDDKKKVGAIQSAAFVQADNYSIVSLSKKDGNWNQNQQRLSWKTTYADGFGVVVRVEVVVVVLTVSGGVVLCGVVVCGGVWCCGVLLLALPHSFAPHLFGSLLFGLPLFLVWGPTSGPSPSGPP